VKFLGPLGLALLVVQTGCTVTAVSAQGDPRPNNACESDSDCSQDGLQRCSQSQGLCQALNGHIEGMLVAVTPASDSMIPHLTFVADVQDIPTSGGKHDLSLPGPSHLTASLQLTADAAHVCYPTFTSDDPEHPLFPAPDKVSLPADVTLSLRQSLLGVPQQVYFGKTGSGFNSKGAYSLDTQLPAGDYEVYLVPPRGQLNCPVPPQLVRSQAVAAGTPALQFVVSAILPLTVDLHWPRASVALTGWIADIIEPIGGRPISTEATLAAPFDPGPLSNTVAYTLSLVYSPVAEAAPTDTSVQSGHELFRLRPPAGVVAPTVFFDRTALGLFEGDHADLSSIFTRLPTAVKLQGQLARLDTGARVSGNVTLLSKSISGMDQGIFGSYETTAEAGDDGLFEVELPPGQYLARAVPPMPAGIPPVDGALSAIEVTWDVPADIDSQAGKLLELPKLAEVTGLAGVQGAQVQAVPSPQPVLVFNEAFGLGPFTPRASSALVDETGRFVMQADPGTFDISVQASESLGFGWFVRAGVQVGDKPLDLGHANPPVPSVLTGTATLDDSTKLSAAAIRAYVYLDKDQAYTRDPKQAVSVIEVAQTRAADDGTFRLLLPSSIAAPK